VDSPACKTTNRISFSLRGKYISFEATELSTSRGVTSGWLVPEFGLLGELCSWTEHADAAGKNKEPSMAFPVSEVVSDFPVA
jgi:hypothetical protein